MILKPDYTSESPGQLIKTLSCLFQTQTTRMIGQEYPETLLLTEFAKAQDEGASAQCTRAALRLRYTKGGL